MGETSKRSSRSIETAGKVCACGFQIRIRLSAPFKYRVAAENEISQLMAVFIEAHRGCRFEPFFEEVG